MRVDWVRLVNMKSFADSDRIGLGPVTVLLGPNNSGKSTVLRAIRFLQSPADLRAQDIRLGSDVLEVEAFVAGEHLEKLAGAPTPTLQMRLQWRPTLQVEFQSHRSDGGVSHHQPFSSIEPENLLYQYLSKRKVSAFEQIVTLGSTTAVAPDLRYLVSKVARLANPATPAHAEYMEICTKVLGFPVTEFASDSGQRAGRVVSNFETIALEDMGEGVASLVGLIVDLCVADGKVFLIEEPENDLHPKALKALLEFMTSKVPPNQLVVSTHSNIVARHLGAVPGARVLRVDQNPEDPRATSTVRDVGTDPRARMEALTDLGYELYDFDLFDGWLILEESSAERIVRDYLIPWFVPRLTRVRTIGVGGASQVEPSFADFHRLFLFTHLEETYRDRAFVVADGDQAGREVIQRMRDRFRTWEPSCFMNFAASAFERYYPETFGDQIDEVLATTDRQHLRDRKRSLLHDVVAWLDADADRGRTALESSAAEVITLLRELDDRLFG